MAQTTAAGGTDEPSAGGAGVPDSPEHWGASGLVGDGRYRLTGRLGRGGMAEVFAAEDVRLGRTVAVKLLRSDLAEDPVSKARFTREAQSVAGLNHHAVVAVYDTGEDVTPNGTVPYIVMELVEGRTIRDLLVGSDEPPPVDQALIIVSGVLEALAYSHAHGIVHRDIKPANVIITNTGAVKVMDFGIARALHGASTTMTQTGMVMGTPQYLSPEQALGKTVDARSDLYATGCLLYELLALRPPFTGETPLSVVYQHVQDEARPPSQTSDRVPPELDGLVLHALAKHPDDRFQTAEEMRGVVQYALGMLHDRGGHTGTWDTGFVPVHNGGSTPAMGMPGQYAQPHPEHTTAEFQAPLLLGPPGGDGGDHGDPGYGDPRPPGGGDGNRWVKPALFVIAAVLAVALGVWFAVAHSGGGAKPPTDHVTPTQSQTTKQSSEPNGEPTQGSTQDTTGTVSGEPPSSSTPSLSSTPSWTPSPSQPTTTAPTTPATSAPPSTTPSAPSSGDASEGGSGEPAGGNGGTAGNGGAGGSGGDGGDSAAGTDGAGGVTP
ncbi:protein kinase domain-containing protein [Streptomyces sp. MI02-7b]|uniref:protein kinase domain-containing protein n=1 Tax=Streptomyces sp. MI02-7b TaxID=462941 RepID=UPI0029B167CA|nr:protein kinase [Streptomyces sp. MI02-7b]MDX3073318.1 protein kinase [Streptomyces sp. MI02-7b]